jgi:nucleoside-diphosphate-sugar epimerase
MQKRGVALYLKELAEKKKITYTLVFTGLFFGLDLPFPLAGIDYKAKKADIIGSGNEKFSITHLNDIGRFLVAILQAPEETENRMIRVAGDLQTANNLLQKFETKVGEKFEVHYQSAEEVTQACKRAVDTKDYNYYFTNAIPLFIGTGVRMLWITLTKAGTTG